MKKAKPWFVIIGFWLAITICIFICDFCATLDMEQALQIGGIVFGVIGVLVSIFSTIYLLGKTE